MTNPLKIQTRSMQNQALFIKNSNALTKVDFSEIIWIKSDGNYCHINTKSQEFTIKRSLVKLQKHLPSDQFVRVHMKYIVSLSAIDKIELTNGNIIIDKHNISIGPRYKSEFLKLLNIV